MIDFGKSWAEVSSFTSNEYTWAYFLVYLHNLESELYDEFSPNFERLGLLLPSLAATEITMLGTCVSKPVNDFLAYLIELLISFNVIFTQTQIQTSTYYLVNISQI